ncbi:hypothetical protein INR49_015982, partial [Caranx melampygus]
EVRSEHQSSRVDRARGSSSVRPHSPVLLHSCPAVRVRATCGQSEQSSHRPSGSGGGKLSHEAQPSVLVQEVNECVLRQSSAYTTTAGLLDGGGVEAAVGDGPQDVLQVRDVSQDGVNVHIDASKPAAHGGLVLLHVPEPRPQLTLHLSVGTSQRVLQLLQAVFIHNTRLGTMDRRSPREAETLRPAPSRITSLVDGCRTPRSRRKEKEKF